MVTIARRTPAPPATVPNAGTSPGVTESCGPICPAFADGVEGVFRSTLGSPDNGGRFLMVSPALARILGHESPDSVLAEVADIAQQLYVDPSVRAECLERLQRDGFLRNAEFQIRRRDGATRWVLESSRLVRDAGGAPAYVEGAVIDITERAEIAYRLARGQAVLSAVLDTMDQGMAMVDALGGVVAHNRRLIELLDCPPDLLAEGTPFERLLRWRAERGDFGAGAPEALTTAALAALSGGDRTVTVTEQPGGRVLEQRANPLPEGGFVLTCTDITERRQAEEALRAARESLIQAEAMAALGSLVAGVAHEINTPIGTALTAASHLGDRTAGFLEAFENGTLKKSDAQAYARTAGESTTLIVANIGRASELIQSFKQVAVDQASEERRRFELKPYIDEVLISLRPRLKKAPVTVAVECAAGLWLDGYPGAIGQVLTNLVMNALTHAFGPEAAGQITITATGTVNGAVELRFADDGRGISKRHLPRIFEPFFTTRRGTGGTGLGLHIVYNIVTQRLGGVIRCDSAAGKGTVFLLRFPRVAPRNG